MTRRLHSSRRPPRFVSLAVAASLVVAACGGGDDDTRSDDGSADGGGETFEVADDDPVESAPEATAAEDSATEDQPADDQVADDSLQEPDPDTGDDADDGLADWTVLIYVMGDNDLEPFAVQDLLEMSEITPSDRVNVVALADRHPEYAIEQDPFDDFETARLFRVGMDGLEASPEEGEVNVGDPEVLAAFIEQGITTAPAEHYAVVLWNHGAGWPGMGPDETDGNDILDLADISQGFEQGLAAAGIDEVDIVGFDACLMASYEVASVMDDHARFMLASAELEPGHGWNYAALDALSADPDLTPEELGQTIMDGFAQQAAESGTDEQITLSLVDLDRMGDLEAGLAALAEPLQAEPQLAAPLLARAQADALKFGANPDPSLDSFHVDLGQVAASLGQADPLLAEPAAAVAQVIDEMVVTKVDGVATRGATGLSIYFPPFADVFRQGYLNLQGVDVWPDLLTSYFTAGQSIPEEEQVQFTNENGEGEYFFDEDGLNLFGVFDTVAQNNVVDATIFYGVLDENDGSIIYIGEEPGEISTDGSGIAGAIYDLTVLTISDGIDTDFAYLDLGFDLEAGVATIDVPLWYVDPTEFDTDAPPLDVVLSLVLDLDFNILSETYYRIDENGIIGELVADPEGLIFPVVLNEYPDGSTEWLTLSEVGLFADLPNLQYDLEPLDPGTGLYAELVLTDFGGNSTSVSMFDVIPG
ncbi:MAG: clostripain-related cysteine peptidase [Actinomycetota bacterium]